MDSDAVALIYCLSDLYSIPYPELALIAPIRSIKLKENNKSCFILCYQ